MDLVEKYILTLIFKSEPHTAAGNRLVLVKGVMFETIFKKLFRAIKRILYC